MKQLAHVFLIGPVYPYRGGISHFNTQLADAFIHLGHKVNIISFKRQYPSWLYPGKTDKDPSLEPLKANANYILDPLFPWTWAKTVKTIRSAQPDLVIIHWWTTFWGFADSWMSQKLKQSQIPVVYLIHNVLPHERKAWDGWIAKLALRPASGIITMTLYEKERLVQLLPNARVAISPMPVYTHFSSNTVSKPQARLSLGLPSEGIILLFFGLVRPYKGLSVLLQAIAQIPEGKRPFLLIAGEFWKDKHYYLNQIKELGIANSIRIEDRYIPNEEVDIMFKAVDALVAPYLQGTQSAAASLAIGYGLPIIVSEHISKGLSLDKDDLVLPFPTGDNNALSLAIQQIPIANHAPKINNPNQENGWDRMIQAILNQIPTDENP